MDIRANEINRGYINAVKSWGRTGGKEPFFKRIIQYLLWGDVLRIILLPFLFAYGICLAVFLSLYKHSNRSELSPFHKRTLLYIDEFVVQYPMHLYPLVAKAFELVFLKEYISLMSKDKKILEIAIGEGTLSNRVFPADTKVVGLDLNPYSLVKTNRFNHVQKRVVCDCLQPPVRPGTFDLLVANNFLHHVSNKRTTLFNWAKIANFVAFNENTPVWASAFTMPFLLRRLGLSRWAEKSAMRITTNFLQCLEDKEKLDELVGEFYIVGKRESYMDKTTFFLCSIFSALTRGYGPTPILLKNIFLGVLKPIVLPLTKKLAELLVYFDSHQSRNNDAFISYFCQSKNFVANQSSEIFICPECRGKINGNVCLSCGRSYPVVDNMLFLLSENLLRDIADSYNPLIAESIQQEHL